MNGHKSTIMSRQANTFETLFSFEVLVEYIRIDNEIKVSDELALGLRLLDFPTLLIYQPENKWSLPKCMDEEKEHHAPVRTHGGEFPFNKGKSCLFKMNIDSLHSHLSNTPLYAMVLDVRGEIPKLAGTSLISLAKMVDRIKFDVNAYGISTPSSHGEKGLVGIFDLMGEKIGLISLGYKLLSLGASLLPHVSENRANGVCREQQMAMGEKTEDDDKKSVQYASRWVQCPKLDEPDGCKIVGGLTEWFTTYKEGVCVSTQTEDRTRCNKHQSLQVNDNNEEDVTTICPPHLFYAGSLDNAGEKLAVDPNLPKLDLDCLILEDVGSEDERPQSEGPRPPVIKQRMELNTKTTNGQEPQISTNTLGEALRQLPLLNALLVELSQLNSQNDQQPLSIHPNLACIYNTSTDPSVGHVNTSPKAQNKLLLKSRQMTSPRLKYNAPLNCSIPQLVQSVSEKQVKSTKGENVMLETKTSGTSPRRKLVFGTTKTFRLRLKQIPPGLVKRHECMETQPDSLTRKIKEKTLNSGNKTVKHTKRNKMSTPHPFPDENIETVISSITDDSTLQEPFRLKTKNSSKSQRKERDDIKQKLLEQYLHSKAETKQIYLPSVHNEDSLSRDMNDDHKESNPAQPECDRTREEMEYPGSSRSRSPKSCYSASSRGEKEEGEYYIDDFTSLEPSDAYSPDRINIYSPEPLSSPETTLSKAQMSPSCSDSSDSTLGRARKRTGFPKPVKALSSPQRSLRGTHIIRTQHLAHSVSSDNDDRDGSATSQNVRSRNQVTNYSRATRSSVTQSLRSSRYEQNDSPKDSALVRGFSADSPSSFEPQEDEELEDDLGTLDFKKKIQHISQLVVNKLPGYTM